MHAHYTILYIKAIGVSSSVVFSSIIGIQCLVSKSNNTGKENPDLYLDISPSSDSLFLSWPVANLFSFVFVKVAS